MDNNSGESQPLFPDDPGAGDEAAQVDAAGAGPDVAEVAPALEDTEDENPGPPDVGEADGDAAPEDDGTDAIAEGTHEDDADAEPAVE
jgi:hypothetical protein